MTSLKVAPPILNPVKAALKQDYRHHAVVPMRQFQVDSATNEAQELYLPLVLLYGYEEEMVEANAYADTLASFKGKAPKKDEPSNWDQLLDANRAYWTIFQSARSPLDLNVKWFDNKQEVQKTYTWDSANIIMEDYVKIKMTQPCYQNIDFSSPTVFQDIIDQIKRHATEDQSYFFLNSMNTFHINQLIKFLVKERETYHKSNTSSGKQ